MNKHTTTIIDKGEVTTYMSEETDNTSNTSDTTTPVGRTFKLSPSTVSEFRPIRSTTIKDIPTEGDSTQVFYRFQSANESILFLETLSPSNVNGDGNVSNAKLVRGTLAKTLCTEEGALFPEHVIGELPMPVLGRILSEIGKHAAGEVEEAKNA